MISDEPDFVDREDEERRYRALSLAVQWHVGVTKAEIVFIAEDFADYLKNGVPK